MVKRTLNRPIRPRAGLPHELFAAKAGFFAD
jgi:hypothetical protein